MSRPHASPRPSTAWSRVLLSDACCDASLLSSTRSRRSCDSDRPYVGSAGSASGRGLVTAADDSLLRSLLNLIVGACNCVRVRACTHIQCPGGVHALAVGGFWRWEWPGWAGRPRRHAPSPQVRSLAGHVRVKVAARAKVQDHERSYESRTPGSLATSADSEATQLERPCDLPEE
jgi:hypothetical protein